MGRYPKCKTCANIVAGENGSHFCKERGEETTPDRSFPCESFSKAPKQKKTPEELSLIRSQAGRKGGKSLFRGGRAPTKQMSVRFQDWEIFGRMAEKHGVSMSEAFHRICKNIVAKHPELTQKTNL